MPLPLVLTEHNRLVALLGLSLCMDSLRGTKGQLHGSHADDVLTLCEQLDAVGKTIRDLHAAVKRSHDVDL